MPGLESSSALACILSFRHLLTESLESFLGEAGLEQPGTAEVLGELAVTLSRYHEEGQPLFPTAFLGDALEPMLRVLGGRDAFQVGSGPRTPETIQRALKQCAQLGQGRWWVLYLLLVPEGLAYGVFRVDPFPLVETPLERLRRAQDKALHVVGVLQLAENVIELRARGGLHRHVYLSGAHVDATPPTQTLDALAAVATREVSEPLRADTQAFYRRVLFEAMQQANHGTLVAVLPGGSEGSGLFADGILLPRPVDVAACVAAAGTGREEGAVAAVFATAQLLRGMMATDGITVLRADGCIVAYNVFLRHPATLVRGPGVVGGARRRTYEVLCTSVGADLLAAFIRSQDGAIALHVASPPA